MHIPVFEKEIEKIAQIFSGKKILDLTYGGGGYSKLFLQNKCIVSAMDCDPEVQKYKLQDVNLITDNYSNIENHFNIDDFDLIVADLGISTMQLENRGISFMKEQTLDMRLDLDGLTLAQKIRRLPVFQMEKIIREYGEEKQARKIANNIERFRTKQDIETTLDLRKAVGIDDFKLLARVFQAFRIFINNELGHLESLLKMLVTKATNLIIVTFHSLEDRLVKNFFKLTCNENIGFLIPTAEEIENNPKSRSAKLRYLFQNKNYFLEK